MIHLLFLCSDQAVRSPMARAFARRKAGDSVRISAAGTDAAAPHPLTRRVMEEADVALDETPPSRLSDLLPGDFDVVVSLCHRAGEQCGILPGNPERVDWDVVDPRLAGESEDELLDGFRRTRDTIERLVDDLFDRGYLHALAESRKQTHLILDNLSEGILAHDFNRRIFLFNRAAERITGHARSDVLGRPCDEVFPGGLCGGKCACRRPCPGEMRPVRQVLDIRAASGETRRVDMSIQPFEDTSGRQIGLLASFRDATREHDLARRLGEIEQFAGIVGRDEKMLEIYDLIRDVADSNVSVLITGESGTGKELVAAAIHNESPRARGLFVPVNCGALPESLLESELFGHVRGAFTGAIRDKKGRFELADGGTIFLDEIGDISQAMQVKLLRVLQEGTFQRLGSSDTIHADVRVISATNKDLLREIEAGRFREDLYYRLGVMPIHLPPLRARRLDIPLLAEHALRRALREAGREPESVCLSEDALEVMLSHGWPGNVRELQNWMQFALVKCKSDAIRPEHLPATRRLAPQAAAMVPRAGRPGRKQKLDTASVREALAATDGNRSEAARRLGVGRATLYRFLDRHSELV